MARTIREIMDSMKADFVRSSAMRDLYGLDDYESDMDAVELASYYDSKFSTVSIETCIMLVVATCAAAVENMMDWFKEDVSKVVDSERYGHSGWYVKVAKAFQYQDGDGTDYNLDTDSGTYSVIDEEARIVKHASCDNRGYGVRLKVAKDSNGALSPLSNNEKSAFESYINRLKPAGIPVQVISRNADVLKLVMSVYYDPIIFNASSALDRVKSEVNAYLSSIDFNGEYVTMKMVDRLQCIGGLDIIEVDEAYAKHEGYGYVRIENDSRYVPESGYMVLADDSELEINAIAHV